MKLKNDIKKYMTLGAVLAGSTFMVSCDGDDGADGIDGIDGNSPDIAVASPDSSAISVSTLTLTVDSAQGTFTQGQQIFLEFDSATVARSEADINDNVWTDLSLGQVSLFEKTGATSYTFNYQANDNTVKLDNVVLEVTSSKDNSLIGTWTADGSVANPTPQVVTVGGVDNANFITSANGGVDINTDSVQGFRVTGTNTPVFSFADGTTYTLTSNLEAILVSADNFGGNADDSYVFVRALTADATMEIGDPTSLDLSQRYTDGAPTDFEVIAEPGAATPVSGTFEHAIQGSTYGFEEDERY